MSEDSVSKFSSGIFCKTFCVFNVLKAKMAPRQLQSKEWKIEIIWKLCLDPEWLESYKKNWGRGTIYVQVTYVLDIRWYHWINIYYDNGIVVVCPVLRKRMKILGVMFYDASQIVKQNRVVPQKQANVVQC